MSEHRATIEWAREGEFKYETYSRQHVWRFEGGVALPGGAARPGTSISPSKRQTCWRL